MKRIVFFGLVILLFFVILHLITSIYTLWHKQDLLINAQKQLSQEQKQNGQLKKQLTEVKSPQFLEKEARDKLLLVKPGESDVLIDQNLLKASNSATKKELEKPYWQQWLDVFFHASS